MQKLIFLLLFICPVFVMALNDHDHEHGDEVLTFSPVTGATITLLKTFESNNSGSVVGFHTDISINETLTKLIYVDTGNQAYSEDYRCHFPDLQPQLNSQCLKTSGSRAVAVPANKVSFGVEEYIVSLKAVVDIFSRKIGSLPQLQSLTMWQHDGAIWATLAHNAGSGVISSHFMCHVHDADFDCHRTRAPGPHQP